MWNAGGKDEQDHNHDTTKFQWTAQHNISKIQSSPRAHMERSVTSVLTVSQDNTVTTVNGLGGEWQHQTRGPRRGEPLTDWNRRDDCLTRSVPRPSILRVVAGNAMQPLHGAGKVWEGDIGNQASSPA
jgi:hypothetical protein